MTAPTRLDSELQAARDDTSYALGKEVSALRDFLARTEISSVVGVSPRLRRHLVDVLVALLMDEEVRDEQMGTPFSRNAERANRMPLPADCLRERAADRAVLELQTQLERWRLGWPVQGGADGT